MAQHHQPRHAPRHASNGRRVPLADLVAAVRQPLGRPGSLLAKVTSVSAAGGLAVAMIIPSEAASASAADTRTAEHATASLAKDLLDLRAEQQASRASVRAALPAVALQAPAAAAPVAAPTFGAMSFTAVEKPPPPPPPPPPAAAPAGGSSSGGSSSGGASNGGSSAGASRGSGYDWAAANACSCARGLTQNSMAVLAAVKYSFPGMTNIGGVRPDSIPGHPQGRALDFMTSDRGYGDAIANMLISRAGELDIENIIWRQRVWLPSSGWKSMSDRGSATANHYDHVHVTVR